MDAVQNKPQSDWLDIFSYCLPTKKYHYFDSANQLQTRELNSIQTLVRWAFGWYADTHLATVAKKAFQLSVSGGLKQASPQVNETAFKLLQKHASIENINPHLHLPPYQLNSGGEANITVVYTINTSGKQPRISHFELIFSISGQISSVTIMKSQVDRKLYLRSESYLFESTPQHPSQDRLDKTVTDLALAVLTHSSIQEIRCRIRDLSHYKQSTSSQEVTRIQNQNTQKFGWSEVRNAPNGGGRLYVLTKAAIQDSQNHLFAKLPQISIDFATRFMS